MGDPIPLWHSVNVDPPAAGRYLVIVRLYEGEHDGEYVVQVDFWSERQAWHGEDRFGRALPGSVVAWAEEP